MGSGSSPRRSHPPHKPKVCSGLLKAEQGSLLFWPPVPVLSAVNSVLSYLPLRWSPLSPLYRRGFWIQGRDTRDFPVSMV